MKLAHPHLASLEPYQPGKPVEELERELGIENAVKLASNENPMGPSPAAVQAMEAAVAGVHRYPDAVCTRCVSASRPCTGSRPGSWPSATAATS